MLGEGLVTPRVPEVVALSQNSWRPRTSCVVPDPQILSGPLSGEGTDTPPGGSGNATCPQAQVRARLPSFLGKTFPPTAFNTGDVKCDLTQKSPR